MDDRRIQFRVGVLVLSAIISTAILVVLFNGPVTLGLGTYTIYMSFQDAPGITADTPVRKSGILIGRVTDVHFTDDGGVLVTAAIQEDIKLQTNERPRISNGLLGDGVLEFYRGPEPAQEGKFVAPGATLIGDVVSYPLKILGNIEGDLSRTIVSVSQTSDDIGRLAREITGLLTNNEEQFARIIVKAETTLDTLQSAVSSADNFISDPVMRDNLSRSLNEFPVVIEKFQTLMEGLDGTMQSANRNLNNLERFTQPLGDRGEHLVNSIDSTVANLDEMLSELGQFARALQNPDGSLGQFLNNPDLYQNLNQAAVDLDQVLRDARPVIYNTRVFTDTLAREGLRGQLKRRPPIK